MAPTEAAPASPLLSLPWEIRNAILLELLTHQRRREPVFDRRFMQQRVRLRNCFDQRNPKDTNIYIERPELWSLARSAVALQATSRQLRDEVALLVKEKLKTGGEKVPFVLDVMVVKDVGVFPTWLCFPYRTKRILSLRVNVRIVRPNENAVPLEWVELARYPETGSCGDLETSTFWSFYAVLALVSLSRLRYKPAHNKTKGIKYAEAPTNKHRTSVMDAYLVPLEATPYVVDQLFLKFSPAEDRTKRKRTALGVSDELRDSPYYREGYVQFGREVFIDRGYFGQPPMDDEAFGQYSCRQLLESVAESLRRITNYRIHDDELALYQYALANSVGEVTYAASAGDNGCMMSKDTDAWISEFEHDVEWRKLNISKEIAKEKAEKYPSQAYIDMLWLAKRRRALGWQAQFDEEKKNAANR